LSTYEVEGPFATREAAEEAERAAIYTERPLLNRQHTSDAGWLLDSRLALYLADRGIALEECGLRRCLACGLLRGHHATGDLCSDCRIAADAGEPEEWLEMIA
jgi:hypothetical protein